MTARCSHRVTKAGPPLHSSSLFCVAGRHYHCTIGRNGMEPFFAGPIACDGESCKGFLRVSDNGAVWLKALAARGFFGTLSLGSGSDDK